MFFECSDKRPKFDSIKMEVEPRYYQEFLDKVLKASRITSDADIQHIIEVVRSGSSISEIQKVVTYVLTDNPSPRPATWLA